MITLLAALANHGVIGKNGGIPFDEATDRKHFRLATSDQVVVMGRKTFDSIGKPLPNRTNIVLTKSPLWMADGIIVVRSFEECLKMVQSYHGLRQVMIIGGEQIYTLFMPFAKCMILTHINALVDGDTFFPRFNHSEWNAKVLMHQVADEKNQYPFVIRTYAKKK